jgi:hypothetical protein
VMLAEAGVLLAEAVAAAERGRPLVTDSRVRGSVRGVAAAGTSTPLLMPVISTLLRAQFEQSRWKHEPLLVPAS